MIYLLAWHVHPNHQLLKITTAHFQVLLPITQNANGNMPMMVLIVKCNGNKAICNENCMAKSPMLYLFCACHRQRKTIRSAKNTNCYFSSGPFGLIISNTPTLLSTAGSVPHADLSTASLVDLRLTFRSSKFFHLQQL